MKNELKKYYPK